MQFLTGISHINVAILRVKKMVLEVRRIRARSLPVYCEEDHSDGTRMDGLAHSNAKK